jgi:hypothetical protein
MEHRLGDLEAPDHSAREGSDQAIGGVAQIHELQSLVDAARSLRGGQVVQPGRRHQVLARGESAVRGEQLWHVADRPPHQPCVAADVVARDGGFAARRRQERDEHLDGRRLAGAVRSEQPEDFAGLNVEAQRVDCRHTVEAACEFLGRDCRGHRSSVVV